MSRRTLLSAVWTSLVLLTGEEVASFGSVSGLTDAMWIKVVGTNRHIKRLALGKGRHETQFERRFRMVRRLQHLGDGWALPLSAEQLTGIGVGESDTAVLVRVEVGETPRLVISRIPTFAEAMEASLEQHDEALRRLAAVPDEMAMPIAPSPTD